MGNYFLGYSMNYKSFYGHLYANFPKKKKKKESRNFQLRGNVISFKRWILLGLN